MNAGPMTYAEYRRRRHRTARIGIAIALGIMCTIGVSLWIALRGSIRIHIDPDAGPWVVTGYSGFGMSGTRVDHRPRLFDPDAGDVFAPDIVAEDSLSFGWPCRALGYRVVDANRLTSLERLFATPIKTRDSLYKSYIIGGIWRDGVSVSPIFVAKPDIPLTPRPLGFTINTLLAALPLYLLLGGWSDLRSFLRLRKGRCPRCGYDARGLVACPECGLETAPQARAEPSPIEPPASHFRPLRPQGERWLPGASAPGSRAFATLLFLSWLSRPEGGRSSTIHGGLHP